MRNRQLQTLVWIGAVIYVAVDHVAIAAHEIADKEPPCQIAFCVKAAQTFIYVINADGSAPRRLATTGRLGPGLPTWSPDGKKIAFLSIPEEDFSLFGQYLLPFHYFLYVVDATGKNHQRVTTTPLCFPQWSPDGKKILFQSACEDPRHKGEGVRSSAIYVVNADGKEQKRLTPVEGGDSSPSWSPDGSKVAFISIRDGNTDIYVMNADGSGERRLTTHNASYTSPPIWSPDGSRVAFYSNRDGNSDISVVNADGSAERRLTTHNASDAYPIWSPDGKEIAFASSRAEKGGVYLIMADGANERHISDDVRPLAWSPDGNRLLATAGNEIHIIDKDGRNRTRLATGGYGALFSPDGKKVFYRSKRDGRSDIYCVDIDGRNERQVTREVPRELGRIDDLSLWPTKTGRQ